MSEGNSPCTACDLYHTCAIHEVACDQFEWYVETGEIELALPQRPSKETFMEIYFEEELKGEF